MMTETTDPDPDDIGPRPGLVAYLLSNAEAEADKVSENCDAIVRSAGKLIGFIVRHRKVLESLFGEAAIAALLEELKEIVNRARSAARHGVNASGYAEEAHENSLTVSGEDFPTRSAREVRTLDLTRVVHDADGKIVKYVFRVNGIPRQFSRALGALLEALASDEGPSDDRFVPFKTTEALRGLLGIDSNNLQTQVSRLRRKLRDDFGLLLEVIENDRHRGYRLRLPRERPTPDV